MTVSQSSPDSLNSPTTKAPSDSETSSRFPWKLFFKLLGAQVALVLVIAFASGISLRSQAFLMITLVAATTWVIYEYKEDWEQLEAKLEQTDMDLNRRSDALAREREEIEVLMAAVPEAIVAVDQNSRLLFFNSKFALLFGDWKSSSKQTALGEVFRTPEVLDTFRNSLRDGKTTSQSVDLRTRSDQQIRHFTLSVTPLRRESGPVYSAVGIFHDVTELKQAERIRIDFVANVSHELRTPLTAIKGYTDTLAHDIRSKQFDAIDKYLDVINRNTDRLMSLIEDLLDLSSLEASDDTGDPRSGLNVTAVNTREISSRIIAQLEPRRSQKNHIIEPVYGAGYVNADPRRLEQVLVNLIDNAIKYVPQGGKIRVEWQGSPPLGFPARERQWARNSAGVSSSTI